MAMPDAAPFFVAGVVMFLMHRFGTKPELWLLLGLSWLLAQNQLPNLMKTAEGSVKHQLSWGICLAVITVFYLLVLGVALGRLRFFNRKWLTTAGALTFPLYLLHEELGWEIIRRLHTDVAAWPLLGGILAVMLIASWLVHRFIERPSAKAMKKWLTGAGQSAPGAEAPGSGVARVKGRDGKPSRPFVVRRVPRPLRGAARMGP
ncbi:hypothetical protein GCM10020254_41110 [Streptomyces goshikiensis]